tara:strand:+ start:195 stop:554 length:360 start_codon:yes stop_codon:yes gene_type:complete
MGKGQIRRSSKTGMYHPKNGKAGGYEFLVGSRRQVHNGTAFKTSGGLKKKDLMLNKHGRIVSVSKHNTAKKEKRLVKAGYLTKKGKFGFIKVNKNSGKKSPKKKSPKKKSTKKKSPKKK